MTSATPSAQVLVTLARHANRPTLRTFVTSQAITEASPWRRLMPRPSRRATTQRSFNDVQRRAPQHRTACNHPHIHPTRPIDR